jgi:ADP-ribose pyrophosphatase
VNAPADWKILSSKKKYRSHYLTVYEDTMDLAGRKKLYIHADRIDYSTIVPFADDGSILTIKSYRHLVDSYQIEAPSGYIDPGETPRQAAIRELAEETGYTAKRVVKVGLYTLDYTLFRQRGHVFAAYGLEKTGTQKLSRMEKISKIEFLKQKKVEELLLSGKILNAASIVALYRAIHYHKTRSGK